MSECEGELAHKTRENITKVNESGGVCWRENRKHLNRSRREGNVSGKEIKTLEVQNTAIKLSLHKKHCVSIRTTTVEHMHTNKGKHFSRGPLRRSQDLEKREENQEGKQNKRMILSKWLQHEHSKEEGRVASSCLQNTRLRSYDLLKRGNHLSGRRKKKTAAQEWGQLCWRVTRKGFIWGRRGGVPWVTADNDLILFTGKWGRGGQQMVRGARGGLSCLAETDFHHVSGGETCVG